MTVPVSIASSVAGRLAGMLVGPLGAKLKDEAFGTDAARAVERVCREAVDDVVRMLSTARAESDVVHVMSLLDDALALRGASSLPLAESLVEGRGLEAWQASFDVLGFDADTLPIDFEAFVRELSVVLPAKLRAEAARHDSPLFEQVAVADLDWLRCNAADLRAAIESTVVAPAVPLAAELERALDASYERCRDTDTRYYTPHMLLTLIDLGDGVVRTCFDRVEPGLAGQMRTGVARYVADSCARVAEPFVAFRWRERNDVRQAQRLAAETESPVVTSALLFAGVLDTKSSTQKQLRARLGAEAFERLRAAALAAHTISAPGTTPGAVFGELA